MADVPPEKSLDDFFAKRDKKKKKEKGKGKEAVTGPTSAVIKKNKREKEKSAKNENQDAQIEKVTLVANFLCAAASCSDAGVVSNCVSPVTIVSVLGVVVSDDALMFRQFVQETRGCSLTNVIF